jgi:hypothetical protein
VFGSFGYFYDVMKMSLAEGLYGGDKYLVTYYTLDTMEWERIGTPEGDGFYLPGTQVDQLDWRIPAIESTDPDMRPMTQTETSFGLEKELLQDVSLSARFVYKHLIYAIEDIGFMTPEGETYLIANPGFGRSSIGDPKYPPAQKPNGIIMRSTSVSISGSAKIGLGASTIPGADSGAIIPA